MPAATALALDPSKAVTQYVRDSWGLREGLPQLSVSDLAQTPDGYIWLATEEGLVRFDGVRFTVFHQDNTPGLRSHHIEALIAGRDGSLWIGTLGGGLARFKDGTITPYGAPEGLGSDVVLALHEDRGGDLWVGTQGGGLAQFHAGAWRHFRAKDGLPSDEVLEVEGGSDGSVWVGTSGGLARLKGGALRTYPIPGGSEAIQAMREDRHGQMWVSVRQRGLFRVEGDRLVPVLLPAGFAPAAILAILDDSDGNLWLGTDMGLRRWSGGVMRTYGPKDGRAEETVLKLWEDGQHALWMGTLAGGLVRLRDGDFTTYSREEGLPSDFVRTITEDPQGDIWIGSRGGGLVRLRDGRFTLWGKEAGIPHPFVYTVLRTRDGSLWVGTHGAGLFRQRDERTSSYTRAQGLPNDFVRVLYEDRADTLWIGFESGGLARLDGARFRYYGTQDGLANDSVYSVLEDRRGDLWVGTNDGLNRLHEGRFSVYRAAEGLGGNQVRSLYEDPTGALWIGTMTGMSRFKDGRFTAYGRKEGLGDAVFSIQEDAQRNIWMSGNQGVLRVSRADLEAVATGATARVRPRLFGVADGLKTRECNGGVQPAGWKAHDGRLWFATMQGAVVVDPARLRAIDPPAVPIVEGGSADASPLDLRRPMRVVPGEGRLELSYTSPSFWKPEDVSFRYRLDGLDRDWIQAGPRRVAYYTNVPAGRYRFRVMACDLDGACSAEASSAELELLPHFVETRTFTALCIFGAGLVVWSGHRFRVRRLRAHERELQRHVEEAVSQIKVLDGLLPICAWCKKIRDDGGYWGQLESYILAHTDTSFTHGICPDCRDKLRKEDALRAPAASAAAPHRQKAD